MTQPITTIVVAEQGPAGPQGLHPQASWNAQSAPYVRDTVLSHNGALWLALRSNSVEPSLEAPDDWAPWIANVATLGPDGQLPVAGVQVNSTGGTGVAVTSGTGAADVGISVTRSNGARSGIDIHNPTGTPNVGAGQHLLRFHNDAADGVTWPVVPTYINGRGAYYSQAWLIISGTWTGTTADTTVIQPPTSDPFMLGVWGDVVGPCIQVRCAPVAGAYNFCGLDRNANYTFSVEENGALKWGAGTRAAMTTSLSLTMNGGLTLSAPANGLTLDNNLAVRGTAVNGTAYQLLQIDSGNAFNLGNGSIPGHVQAFVPDGRQWRFLDHTTARVATLYNATRNMAVGSIDDAGAGITVKPSSDSLKGIVSRANSATQSANLFEAQDSGGAIKSGMNKAGYIFTQLNAAPADGDLAPNQAMIWFDSTNGAARLMIKGRTANGTVVSGSVPLS